MTYSKYSFKNLGCQNGKCENKKINIWTKNVSSCYDECLKKSPTCTMLMMVPTTATRNENCSTRKKFCDFTKNNTGHLKKVTCLPGPMLEDWSENHYSNRQQIIDGSNSTCK